MGAIPDSTLADAEQIIADLRRQLAECRAERDEALQRETATAEVLQVINSSPVSLRRSSTRCWRRRCACAERVLAYCRGSTVTASAR